MLLYASLVSVFLNHGSTNIILYMTGGVDFLSWPHCIIISLLNLFVFLMSAFSLPLTDVLLAVLT